MSALRTLIVDDERPARAKLRRLLGEDARCEVVGEAQDGLEALEQIERLAPQLLILDIQMPGLDGFELLASIEPPLPFAVVISTAHDAHALRAFEANAIDYLLKPYDRPRFTRALDRACAIRLGEAAQRGLAQSTLAGSHWIALKVVGGPWLSVAREDIVRVAAANKHSALVLRDGEHLVRQPLSVIAARLGGRFVQSHRSEYVNLDAIVSVEPWLHGDSMLTLTDGSTRVLTRTYRKTLLSRFRER
jgi:two-component system LytT family response regulator